MKQAGPFSSAKQFWHSRLRLIWLVLLYSASMLSVSTLSSDCDLVISKSNEGWISKTCTTFDHINVFHMSGFCKYACSSYIVNDFFLLGMSWHLSFQKTTILQHPSALCHCSRFSPSSQRPFTSLRAEFLRPATSREDGRRGRAGNGLGVWRAKRRRRWIWRSSAPTSEEVNRWLWCHSFCWKVQGCSKQMYWWTCFFWLEKSENDKYKFLLLFLLTFYIFLLISDCTWTPQKSNWSISISICGPLKATQKPGLLRQKPSVRPSEKVPLKSQKKQRKGKQTEISWVVTSPNTFGYWFGCTWFLLSKTPTEPWRGPPSTSQTKLSDRLAFIDFCHFIAVPDVVSSEASSSLQSLGGQGVWAGVFLVGLKGTNRLKAPFFFPLLPKKT